ncbi:MAG: AraC family transcriptional regulator [Cytophagales bacterium]|nr:AraC family transcriptional regulator [Cytophagales bacterium]
MKLVYKNSNIQPERCFSVRQDNLPCIEQDWHFHPEIELIYFLKSTGTRYVGNSIGNFEPGELYMIGSNVPHLFRNHREYYGQESHLSAVDLVVVKFQADFLGKSFTDLVEAKGMKRLFHLANRGIKFSKTSTYLSHKHILGLLRNEGLSGIVELLNVLDILSATEDYEILCEEEIIHNLSNDEKERMGKIISFLNQNFDKRIELEEVSEIACMTPTAFCRYFKKKTKKSFTQFLNEIRLGHACKLLIEGDEQIATIAYQSGFNTMTNFNRQFKSFLHMTPTDYMEKYKVLEEG